MKSFNKKQLPGERLHTFSAFILTLASLAFAGIAFCTGDLFAQDNQNQKAMKIIDYSAAVVNVRYIVNDVDAAVSFYKDMLDFEVVTHVSPGFALLSAGNLRLFLNKPGAGGAGQAMPDGTRPQPGGWNRMLLTVKDLEKTIQTLKARGAKFRNELVAGNGGKQILLLDPSDNVIELFEPHR